MQDWPAIFFTTDLPTVTILYFFQIKIDILKTTQQFKPKTHNMEVLFFQRLDLTYLALH
jgi:hypothetical protein